MRIRERNAYIPRLSLGFKKFLLQLNRTLDTVKRDVNFSCDYWFYYNRSISSSSSYLTKIEILVLFLEDRRFFIHRGFELRSAFRVLRRFLRSGKIGGMSTIDQQVVRISTMRSERTIARKSREILLAYLCNFHLPKKKILDYYIHNAYLGYRIQGCEEASKALFGVAAAKLSWDQAALIASLYALPIPKLALEKYLADPDYPIVDPSELLDFTLESCPRWTKRVKARMEHVLKNQDFRPKSR